MHLDLKPSGISVLRDICLNRWMNYQERMDSRITVMGVGLKILVTPSALVIHSSIATSARLTFVKIANPSHGLCAQVLAKFASK